MVKKILIGLCLIVLLFISIEIVRLIQLKMSLSSYAAYWKKYPTSGSFTYVALGDSAAQSIGASKPEFGYVGLLARQIESTTGKSVRIINLSVSGATVEDVIKKQVPQVTDFHPDLITVDVGSNNISHFNAKTFQENFKSLAKQLPDGSFVANIPYFGGRVRTNNKALEASSIIADSLKGTHLYLVDLQTETREKQSIFNYAADLFHPSNRGYLNWEHAYWKVIEPTLHT